MSQRQRKSPSERQQPERPPRPAGIQAMDLKLYESVQQAIRKMAGTQEARLTA